MDYYYDNTPANPDDDDFSSINNLFKTRDEDDPIIDFDTGYVNKDGIDFRYIFYPYTIGEKSSSSGFSTKNNLNNIVDLSDIFQNSAVSVVSYVFQDNEEFYEVLGLWFDDRYALMFQPGGTYGPINLWGTQNVTDMSNIFSGKSSFDSNISSWNVSNVTDMSYMFSRTYRFRKNINYWDVSNVTNMNYMFYKSNIYTSLYDWNTIKVTNMENMFYLSDFKNDDFNISEWNTDNVTTMRQMFRQSKKFSPDYLNWNTSNVTDMEKMFFRSQDFNPTKLEWNTSNVDTFKQMFERADDGAFNCQLDYWFVKPSANLNKMFFRTKLSTTEGWNGDNGTPPYSYFNSPYEISDPTDAFNSLSTYKHTHLSSKKCKDRIKSDIKYDESIINILDVSNYYDENGYIYNDLEENIDINNDTDNEEEYDKYIDKNKIYGNGTYGIYFIDKNENIEKNFICLFKNHSTNCYIKKIVNKFNNILHEKTIKNVIFDFIKNTNGDYIYNKIIIKSLDGNIENIRKYEFFVFNNNKQNYSKLCICK
jgi:surface protein